VGRRIHGPSPPSTKPRVTPGPVERSSRHVWCSDHLPLASPAARARSGPRAGEIAVQRQEEPGPANAVAQLRPCLGCLGGLSAAAGQDTQTRPPGARHGEPADGRGESSARRVGVRPGCRCSISTEAAPLRCGRRATSDVPRAGKPLFERRDITTSWEPAREEPLLPAEARGRPGSAPSWNSSSNDGGRSRASPGFRRIRRRRNPFGRRTIGAGSRQPAALLEADLPHPTSPGSSRAPGPRTSPGRRCAAAIVRRGFRAPRSLPPRTS